MKLPNPKAPSTNGGNGGGRDGRGRFTKGNPGGPGNPLGPAIARLRAELVRAVTPSDMRAIAQALIRRARDGDTLATRILFGYLLGRPIEFDVLERIEALERQLEAGKGGAA